MNLSSKVGVMWLQVLSVIYTIAYVSAFPNLKKNDLKYRGEPTSINEFHFLDSTYGRLNDLYRLLNSDARVADIFHDTVKMNMSDLNTFQQIFQNDANPKPSLRSASLNVAAAAKNIKKDGYLHAGDEHQRTEANCYVIQFRLPLDKESMDNLKNVLQTFDATIRHSLRHALVVCFPTGEIPLTMLKYIPSIDFIERDQRVRVNQVQESAPWGLSRLVNSDPTAAEDSTEDFRYEFGLTGSGVTAYVLDSGVLLGHPEFQGRASIGFSVNGDPPTSASPDLKQDCAGHGTEVASVIGGINVGVAKSVRLVIAQVLDCEGSGQNSDLVAALDWVVNDYQASRSPALINMSVGGPKSLAVDAAILRAMAAGIPVIVAAGNNNVNACGLSPSGVPGVISVGASTEENRRANFSNYGDCVTLFAPGIHIAAARFPDKTVKNGIGFVSGTSLSAPFVSGIVAMLLQMDPSMNPAKVLQTVIDLSAKDVLRGSSLRRGSPNRLAQIPKISAASVDFFPLIPGFIPLWPGTSSKDGDSILEAVLIIIGSVVGGCLASAVLIFVLLRCSSRRNSNNDNNNNNTQKDEETVKVVEQPSFM